MKRGVSLGLCGCLLLAPGCRTGEQRAGEYRNRIDVGMTRDEVEGTLGSPDGWQENVGGYEVWAYSYKPSFGHFLVWRTVDIAEFALLVGFAFGLFFITRGLFAHWTGEPLPRIGPDVNVQSGSRYQRFVFRIGFDLESGRVAFVSSPLPE